MESNNLSNVANVENELKFFFTAGGACNIEAGQWSLVLIKQKIVKFTLDQALSPQNM